MPNEWYIKLIHVTLKSYSQTFVMKLFVCFSKRKTNRIYVWSTAICYRNICFNSNSPNFAKCFVWLYVNVYVIVVQVFVSVNGISTLCDALKSYVQTFVMKLFVYFHNERPTNIWHCWSFISNMLQCI